MKRVEQNDSNGNYVPHANFYTNQWAQDLMMWNVNTKWERERDTETERYRDRKRETYKQTDRDFTTPPINYFFKIGKYFTI